MFQITKSTRHDINLAGLNTAIAALTAGAGVRKKLYLVVPHTIFLKAVVGPMVPPGSAIPAHVDIFVLEYDLNRDINKLTIDQQLEYIQDILTINGFNNQFIIDLASLLSSHHSYIRYFFDSGEVIEEADRKPPNATLLGKVDIGELYAHQGMLVWVKRMKRSKTTHSSSQQTTSQEEADDVAEQ